MPACEWLDLRNLTTPWKLVTYECSVQKLNEVHWGVSCVELWLLKRYHQNTNILELHFRVKLYAIF